MRKLEKFEEIKNKEKKKKKLVRQKSEILILNFLIVAS